MNDYRLFVSFLLILWCGEYSVHDIYIFLIELGMGGGGGLGKQNFLTQLTALRVKDVESLLRKFYIIIGLIELDE